MEAGGFRLGGGLVGILSLSGSHWDCFSSWDTVGAAVGIFVPEGSLDAEQTKETSKENKVLKDLRVITQSELCPMIKTLLQ